MAKPSEGGRGAVPHVRPDQQKTFKNLRRRIGKGCRWWEETDQADGWLASGLVLASKGFRRIAGYRELPELIRALERKYESELGGKSAP